MNLVAGDYVLTVIGYGLSTGPYSFPHARHVGGRAGHAGHGGRQSVTQSANSTNVYSFTATAGDQFSFDLTALTDRRPSIGV